MGHRIRDGDLYKIAVIADKSFTTRYGYSTESEREKWEPTPIYPDFIKRPVYTDEGAPFVTLMQDPCENYEPNGRSSDRDCGTCIYTERGNDLIGICKCRKNKI